MRRLPSVRFGRQRPSDRGPMLRLVNTTQDYPWGSPTAIPDLLGTEPSGRPAAELWLGAHPSAPSRAGGVPLDALIARDPASALGRGVVARFGAALPYLSLIHIRRCRRS